MSDGSSARVIKFPRARGVFEEIADAITPNGGERYLVRECGAEIVSLCKDELDIVEDVLAAHGAIRLQAQDEI